MMKANLLIFFLSKLSSFIDWCYYTQVSYTGSWEPLVGVLTPLSAIFQLYHGDQF